MAKIPPDVRQQLEADLEFEQGEASLYISAGDIARGTEYLNRVETFYMLHHSAVPSGLEVQHGWLLYNAGDDKALYPVLLGLDARRDLTSAQREQVETLWASWAVRRAEFFLDNGNVPRGVQLLQAASEDYPNNMGVRSAVAGAYAKVGRPEDALALFKTIPLAECDLGRLSGSHRRSAWRDGYGAGGNLVATGAGAISERSADSGSGSAIRAGSRQYCAFRRLLARFTGSHAAGGCCHKTRWRIGSAGFVCRDTAGRHEAAP